jgi:hypothetical protein
MEVCALCRNLEVKEYKDRKVLVCGITGRKVRWDHFCDYFVREESWWVDDLERFVVLDKKRYSYITQLVILLRFYDVKCIDELMNIVGRNYKPRSKAFWAVKRFKRFIESGELPKRRREYIGWYSRFEEWLQKQKLTKGTIFVVLNNVAKMYERGFDLVNGNLRLLKKPERYAVSKFREWLREEGGVSEEEILCRQKGR